MGHCLRTGKPCRYITNTKVNSAFHPSGEANRVPACMAGVMAGCIHLCQVAGNTVIPYGRWRSVALRWVSHEELYHLTILTITQGSQQEVVQFQDKGFSKFQDILKSQNVENIITFYVPQISHKHPKGAITITKAMLHKKPWLPQSQRETIRKTGSTYEVNR